MKSVGRLPALTRSVQWPDTLKRQRQRSILGLEPLAVGEDVGLVETVEHLVPIGLGVRQVPATIGRKKKRGFSRPEIGRGLSEQHVR